MNRMILLACLVAGSATANVSAAAAEMSRAGQGAGTLRMIDMLPGQAAGPCARTQAAVTALGSAGGIVEEPAGDLTWEKGCTVTVSQGPVRIVGTGWNVNGPGGTRLLFPDPSVYPFVFAGHAASGSRLMRMAFWQTAQPAGLPNDRHVTSAMLKVRGDNSPRWTGAPYVPAPYPGVLHLAGKRGDPTALSDAGIEDCLFTFVNKGMVADGNVARPVFRDIIGQATDFLVSLDDTYDTAQIVNVRLIPVLSIGSNQIFEYQMSHADIVRLYRADSPHLDGLFGLFVRSAIHFGQSPEGAASDFDVGTAAVDHGTYGIYVDASVTSYDGSVTRAGIYGHVGELDHNGELYSSGTDNTTLPDSAAIRDDGRGSVIRVGFLRSIFSSDVIEQNGERGLIQAAQFEGMYWGHGGDTPGRPMVFQAASTHDDPNQVDLAGTPRIIAGPSTVLHNAGTDGIVDGLPQQGFHPIFSTSEGTLAAQPTINAATYQRIGGRILGRIDVSLSAAQLGHSAGGFLRFTPPTAIGADIVTGTGADYGGALGPLVVVAGGYSKVVTMRTAANGATSAAGERLIVEFSYDPQR